MVGALPPRPLAADFAYPPFWDEVTRGDKKVVTVAQGTLALEYDHLIIPTIKGLADRDDVLVVATLGSKGAQLPDDFEVPGNTRVVDYLLYNAILPHSSAFVFNSGFGGFTQSALHGVPMVFAGEILDKPEVALRGEWAGVGINLKTGQPTPEQIGEAVGKILADDRYKRRVMEVKAENEALGTMEEVERAILEQAALA
jgi:UDP:flavonoid glycosyltransferase YjiC (YdhE family)